jgi:hypothetical protein
LLVGLMAAASRTSDYAEPQQEVYVQPASSFSEVYNIKPYAKDGTPLTDVYLYDQDGKPLITNPEDYGYVVDRSCGEPILNRYPLPLIMDQTVEDTGQASAPPTCPAATPSEAPVATATASEAPVATATASEAPVATATPVPTRRR